jgi:hypothetical protein
MCNSTMHEVSRNVRGPIFDSMLSAYSLRDSSLRPTWKQCVKCSDMVDSHVKCLYCFFFLLEDEEGKNLFISISDEDEDVNI